MNTSVKTLVFIPTYNERENVSNMAQQILALGLDADLLFMDDGSPDGTGAILDELAANHPRLFVIHRTGKLGIGSAHLDGIRWAYDQGYERLVTMDCDFTHMPADVLRLMDSLDGHELAVGSRYMEADSLPGWNVMRRSLTGLGHFLTRRLLGIEVDATGALRAYELRKIPRQLFDLVTARGYAFFFESMFILVHNGLSVKEIPIVLPARTYGHSKMTWREAWRSGSQLISTWKESITDPARFRVPPAAAQVDPALVDPQGWDAYWDKSDKTGNIIYGFIAALYRTSVIRPQLEKTILRHFPNDAFLLHAGCGSGQVDTRLQQRMRITAIDISPSALRVYHRNNPAAFAVQHASILDLPFAPATFDGIYNLGVLEHFDTDDIQTILIQFHRALKPRGRLVIFWPHRHATSVVVLKAAHWVLNDVLRKPTKLHPAEISLLRSRRWVELLMHQAGFRIAEYSFGLRDFYIQAVVVAEKRHGGSE